MNIVIISGIVVHSSGYDVQWKRLKLLKKDTNNICNPTL